MIGIPVSIFCIAPDLLKEPLAWGIALGIMLFFGLVGYGLFVRPYRLYLKLPLSIDENYELNDSGCYRTHRLEENLYEDYLPKDYNREDVITYQWNQNREYNLQGQFNFYYTISKNSVSRGSMLLYIILLLTIGIFGDLLSELVQLFIGWLIRLFS